MKVLYIGSERSEAQAIAVALRGVDENVSVLWAAQLENAANWLGEARGLDALVMDAPIDGASCLVVLKQLRRLVLPSVVVFIVPDGISPTLDSLHPGAHYVHRNQFLSRDLPIVVTRAIERAAYAELERKVAQTDKLLAEQQAKYDIGMARAAANWEMVDEQLRSAALQVEHARQNQELAAADVDRLSRRESELISQLSNAAAAQDALQRQLADAHLEVAAANERTEQERVAATGRLSERQREFDANIAQALDERRGVEARLAQAVRDREEAEQRHAAAMRDVAQLTARQTDLNDLLAEAAAHRTDLEGRLAATTAAFDDAVTRATRDRAEAEQRHAAAMRDVAQLTERQTDLNDRLGEAAAQRTDLERKLAATKAGFEDAATRATRDRKEAEQRHAAAMRDVAQLTARQTELNGLLTEAAAQRTDLEGKLAATEAAFEDAVARATRERLAVSTKAAEREAELDGQIRRERATRATLEQTLANTTTELDQARDEHERVLAAAAAELTGQRARFEREISQSATEREQLAQRLSKSQAALKEARRTHQAAVADIERLSGREADLASQVADVQAARDTLDGQLAEARSALEAAAAREGELTHVIQQADTTRRSLEQTIADAAGELANERARFDRELSQAATEREDLAQRLSDAHAALDEARLKHQAAVADIERLSAREAELTSQLADVQSERDAIDRQLADARTALAAAAAREADLTREIEHERARRTTLENCLADADAALAQVRQDYQAATADIERLRQREAELATSLADAQARRITLERQLDEAGATIVSAAARESALNAQLEQERAARTALEQTLAGVRHEFHAARADVDRLTEREAELSSQLADAQAVRQAIEQTLADTRARFVEQRQQLEIQLAQEQLEHESRSGELNERNRALSFERDTLQQSLSSLQERSRQLQESLTASVDAFEVSRAESQRLFDHAGVAMFRCTRDGALTDANRACTTLIGRRTLDELEGVDFAAAVFDAPQALSWLIERCVSTRAKESIETTWRRQDGSRLFMRLSARSLPSGMIEVVAEDLTRIRVLEERLGQAHRMEAVGRLASEVATTCSSLIENIQQQGREWLMTADADSRQRGERLFDELGRAAGFLQELAACSDEQARTPMLVDLNTLVRDLEPVLKNVVGGDVEVQLRDTSTPLNVDVGTERIERLLVNLASYGRGRMPAGGRLRIELGTSVVDRHFSAKHPNVRLGLHALITVTESRRAGQDETRQPRAPRRGTPRPGVDFATLQELVSDCGGHLWMKVHPLGEMVAKIRLPLFSQQDQRASRALTMRGARERQTARWFQS